MKFNPDDPKWTAYALGELSAAERAAVEAELDASAAARETVEEIHMASTMLRDELRQSESVAAATLTASQRNVIQEQIPHQRWYRPARFVPAAVAAGLLAAAVTLPLIIGDIASPPAPNLTSREAAGMTTPQSMPVPLSANTEYAIPPVTDGENSRSQPAVTGNEASQSAKTMPFAPTVEERQASSADAGSPPPLAAAVQQVMTGIAAGVVRSAFPVPSGSPPAATAFRSDDTFGAPRTRFNTEAYDQIVDNPFIRASQEPLATFSSDVDTAAYANVRRFLSRNQLPPRDSVRIEEMINYFTYEYPPPGGSRPLAVYTEVTSSPWKPEHRIVRIALKAREMNLSRRPPTSLVFLIDVSGSMDSPEKLPLLKSALKLMIDNLTENDRVAMVVYAGASGLVLGSTPGDRKETILQAVDMLQAGGSTNGAAGIQLAYDTAVAQFIRGGINRVILATDGDFNVGITSQGDLLRLIEEKARSNVFLSVLGFGMGNFKDSTLEKLADQGNGNYAYIDTLNEARKVLVEELGATLMTVAKDVKVQVEFNPSEVNAYRLIGYENRILRAEDFNNDAKDAGDMGAGHVVTALFEIVPKGVDISLPSVDALRYQQEAPVGRPAGNGEMLNVKVRYKEPEGTESRLMDVPVTDRGGTFTAAGADLRFAAAVASFGMILRDSPYKGSSSLDAVIDMAERSRGTDKGGYRDEFIKLVRKARAIRDLQN
jgi:Ca-activated chloride channel family protein